nr:hypothetical protein CFP56_11177 [Quercus suber]
MEMAVFKATYLSKRCTAAVPSYMGWQRSSVHDSTQYLGRLTCIARIEYCSRVVAIPPGGRADACRPTMPRDPRIVLRFSVRNLSARPTSPCELSLLSLSLFPQKSIFPPGSSSTRHHAVDAQCRQAVGHGRHRQVGGSALHAGAQRRRDVQRGVELRDAVPQVPRDVPESELADGDAGAGAAGGGVHAGPGGGQHEREDDAADVGPGGDPERARPDQAAGAQRAGAAGAAHPRGRHGVRRDQGARAGAQQGALRQAPPAHPRPQRLDAQGARAADRHVHPGAGQHGQRDGRVQGAEGGAARGGGLHGEHPPDLPHQGADDQARAGQGPGAGERELGALSAALQEAQSVEAAEAVCGQRQDQEGVHALPAPAGEEQGRFADRERRVLFEQAGQGAGG